MITSLGCAQTGRLAPRTSAAAAATHVSDLRKAILTVQLLFCSSMNRALISSLAVAWGQSREHHERVGGEPQVHNLPRGERDRGRLGDEDEDALTVAEPGGYLGHRALVDEPFDARLGRSLARSGGQPHALRTYGELDVLTDVERPARRHLDRQAMSEGNHVVGDHAAAQDRRRADEVGDEAARRALVDLLRVADVLDSPRAPRRQGGR